MLNLLLDIAPLPRNHHEVHEVIREIPRVVTDTIDTVVAPVQQTADPVSPGGGSIGLIIGAIAAALIALGICIFMVRNQRGRLGVVQS
ncbi:MAG: hypothetical protein IJT98_04670 [Prevotella sp.]|nr:hypothetical protein [Prevotella sp.]